MSTPTHPLPTGTVTFLFTDVAGSTALWENEREAMRTATVRLDSIVAEQVGAAGGTVVKARGEGDSHFCVFARATDAVGAAAAVQEVLAAEPWPTSRSVVVRMALHTGEADLRDADYYGPAVNRAARLRAVAHGGQVLLSQATADLVQGTIPHGWRVRDLGSHRLKDLGRAEDVHELHRAGAPEFGPLLASGVHNLPTSLSGFVGRRAECDELLDLLGQHRLLTLTGAGGVGKTRLAIRVAEEAAARFPDGTWLVELGSLADPALVVAAIAGIFGITEEAEESDAAPLDERLLSFLRERSALVVLDNCEHMIAEAARVADWLTRSCAGLVIMATSREALGVSGERIWLVPSLPLPDGSTGVLADLIDFDAVRLFVERARLAGGRELNEADAPHIARICARLDGIPLAIELAAGKLGVLQPPQLAARLDESFRLLTGGSRTALPRQQTLQAAIDWSYDLLDEGEQALFRRLSVFAGGFTIEAAEAVGGVAPLDEADVLDFLGRLVDKSMVQLDGDTGRYRVLETLRHYGLGKLNDTGEMAASRDRHQQWCAALAEEAETGLRTTADIEWAARIDAELDNLRSAIRWGGPGDAAVRVAAGLWIYWGRSGRWAEGIDLLEGALVESSGTVALALRVKALGCLASLSTFGTDMDVALGWARHCMDEAERLTDPADRWPVAWARMLVIVRDASASEGGPVAAYGPAVDEARRSGDDYTLATVLTNYGMLQGIGVASSTEALEEAVAVARRAGAAPLVARVLSLFAMGLAIAGRYEEAEAALGEADVLATAATVVAARRAVINGRLALTSARGDAEGTLTHLRDLLALATEGGDERMMAWERLRYGRYLATAGYPAEEQVPWYEGAISGARRTGDNRILYRALAARAGLRMEQGDFDGARALLEQARAPAAVDGAPGEADILNDLGRVAFAAGDDALARRHQLEAFECAGMEYTPVFPHVVAATAALALDAGERRLAARLMGYAETVQPSTLDIPVVAIRERAWTVFLARPAPEDWEAGSKLDRAGVLAEARTFLAEH